MQGLIGFAGCVATLGGTAAQGGFRGCAGRDVCGRNWAAQGETAQEGALVGIGLQRQGLGCVGIDCVGRGCSCVREDRDWAAQGGIGLHREGLRRVGWEPRKRSLKTLIPKSNMEKLELY